MKFVKDTFEEYLGKKDHISASDIKNFMTSPKKYYYEKYQKKRSEDERHFPIGSAIHEKILEPEMFDHNFIVFPKIDKRTKDGKEQYKSFLEKAEGKTIIFQDEYDVVEKASESARKNHTFLEMIKDGYKEVSCYTVDEKTGLKIKVRPDILSKSKSNIIDVKSCLDSSPKKFKSDVYNYGYAISAAFYLNFLEREDYIFAAIEKNQPYHLSLFVLSDDFIDYGKTQFRTGLDLIKWSYENNYWCDHNEFELLKECYDLGDTSNFFEERNNSNLLTIINF